MNDLDVDISDLSFDETVKPRPPNAPKALTTLANLRINKVANGYSLVFLSRMMSRDTGRPAVEAMYVAKEFSEVTDIINAHVVGQALE